MDCERGAVMAATLANSGQCPITGTKVISPLSLSRFHPGLPLQVLSTDTICSTLSLMHSCGMYDSAGEFSFAVSTFLPPFTACITCLFSSTFQVGLPAKSGISGVIFVVVPNVMGFCLYSPLVNKNGNSLKGLAFCEV